MPKLRRTMPGPYRRKRLNVSFVDPNVMPILDLLRKLWYNEGKIPRPTYSGAISYMARQFGDIARQPPGKDIVLPLGLEDRQIFALVRDTFHMAGKIQDKSDLKVVQGMLHHIFREFSNGAYLQEILSKKGNI
ncbi:MAG: hypothetical protein WC985_00305 [Thermoplasmata archaeon]